MINQDSISFCDKAHFTSHFKRPLYQSYAYSLIPNTIQKLLTGKKLESLAVEAVGGRWDKPDVVVLFLIDGFGWVFFEKYLSRFPFLSRFEREGVASKISSQFPSTTSAHVTTICTGLEVGQTGIYEWFQYEPKVDRMIAPLLFSFAGDHEVDTLAKNGIAAEEIFPFVTFYDRLKRQNIDSFVIQHENIIHSSYSKTLYKGAERIPYKSFAEALTKSVEICKAHPRPAYVFVYLGDIDAAGHRHDVTSSHFEEAVVSCFTALEKDFWQPMRSCSKRVATIVTADHGMTSVNPRTTINLNKQFPGLVERLQTNRQGQPLVPAGSCRDFFLHIKEEQLQETHAFLSKELHGKADVYLVKDLIDKGFFGTKKPSARFRERVGNLVILPYANESVWWYEKNRFEQNFYAAHGGLTPKEIETIFLFSL